MIEEYSIEFWDKCHKLLAVSPCYCMNCQTPKGFRSLNEKGVYGKPRVIRLALIDIHGLAVPENVGLFCTRCRKAPMKLKSKKKNPNQLEITGEMINV